jgi:ubiquinol-cytochrome c reductase cytochrome c subunit
MPATTRAIAPRLRLVRVALATVLLLGAAAAVTVFAGAGTTEAPPPRAGTAPGPAEEDPLGERVFLRDCAWCHGNQGEGTSRGPSLAESGPATADFYLETGRMPLASPEQEPRRGPPAYPPRTIDALVEHVALLGSGEPVPEVATGDLYTGRELFVTSCAPCHSSSGTGVIVTGGQAAPELFDTGPTQVAEAIRIGPGRMPAFGPSHLDEEEVDDIVTYVEALGDRQVRSGTGLDQFGPIAEGIFVFAVLLPALLVVTRLLGKRAAR